MSPTGRSATMCSDSWRAVQEYLRARVVAPVRERAPHFWDLVVEGEAYVNMVFVGLFVLGWTGQEVLFLVACAVKFVRKVWGWGGNFDEGGAPLCTWWNVLIEDTMNRYVVLTTLGALCLIGATVLHSLHDVVMDGVGRWGGLAASSFSSWFGSGWMVGIAAADVMGLATIGAGGAS